MIDWPTFLSPNARIDFWTILVGIVCNTSCALVGCYLVLRRMSLLGDAISHTVLAGIAFAFLLGGSTAMPLMFVGALLAGLFTAFLAQFLHNVGNVSEDTSLGIVFTSLFALGIILISNYGSVDLDVGCVLYGRLDTVSLSTTSWGGIVFPKAMQSLVPTLSIVILFIVVFWKELKITSFDSWLAKSMGIPVVLVHYLFLTVVSATTVSSLQAVGSIIVIAMLIVPAATAHLLTNRMSRMMMVAVGVGVVSSVVGCLWARAVNTNAAGMMAVVSGMIFVLAVIFTPQQGVISRFVNGIRLKLRIVSEDVVALVYRLEELAGKKEEPVPALSVSECEKKLGRGLMLSLAMKRLVRRDRIVVSADNKISLTERGRELGQSLVRSHRLWESYLQEHFDLPADHLHEPAERVEHYIGPNLQQKLSQELKRPEIDPHGRAIPPSGERDGNEQ